MIQFKHADAVVKELTGRVTHNVANHVKNHPGTLIGIVWNPDRISTYENAMSSAGYGKRFFLLNEDSMIPLIPDSDTYPNKAKGPLNIRIDSEYSKEHVRVLALGRNWEGNLLRLISVLTKQEFRTSTRDFLLELGCPINNSGLTSFSIWPASKVADYGAAKTTDSILYTTEYPTDTTIHSFIDTPTQKPINKEQTTMLDKLKDQNTDAVKYAVKANIGSVANAVLAEKISPYLPENMQMYVKTGIGKLILANLASALIEAASNSTVKSASTRHKLETVSEAMINSAMLGVTLDFDIEGIVTGFLSDKRIESALEKAAD